MTEREEKINSARLPREYSGNSFGWKMFVDEFLMLVDPETASAASTYAYVSRLLKLFHVTNYTVLDVLHEVYLRAYRLLAASEITICYPKAWIKRTAYHVIRELNRENKKYGGTFPDEQTLIQAVESPAELGQLETDLAILKRALQELEADEQRLLTLKVVHDFQWNEIRDILQQDERVIPGDTPKQQQANLRKQKERTLKKLRGIYHALHTLSDLDEG